MQLQPVFTKRIETFPLTTFLFYTYHEAYCTYSYNLLPIYCLTYCHSENGFSSFSQNRHLHHLSTEISQCTNTCLMSRVIDATDRTALEDHPILRQRPCLVGEDVFDLAEIFIDVQRPTQNALIARFVVQVKVVRDEVDLSQLHEFDSDIEGQWDHHLGT